MNPMRERTKEHFPTVLLTLLSIVQALALELLWSFLHEHAYLYELSWAAVHTWIQVSATFLGLILVLVAYVGNVMRFSWVPSTSDTVFPFAIGILQFMLIDTMGPDNIAYWFLLMAGIFTMMHWVAHSTMVKARNDSDNADCFKSRAPAELSDFYPQITSVIFISGVGFVLLLYPGISILSTLGLLGVISLFLFQYYSVARFWENSVAE